MVDVNSSPKLSVVIPTFNEEKHVSACIDSLLEQVDAPSYELIVVDGGSSDSTEEKVKSYGDKVTFIRQKSKGVGGARNDGFEISKGNILVTTDADTVLEPRWLSKIHAGFENPDVVCVYGPATALEKSSRKYDTVFKISVGLTYLVDKLGMKWTYGFNTAFRKDAFKKVGGYSSIKICDDFEIAVRLKKLGKIVYYPNLTAYTSIRRLERDGLFGFLIPGFKNYAKILLSYKFPKLQELIPRAKPK